MKRRYRSLATLLLLCLATAGRASDTTPVSDPKELGFSPSRLQRIAAWEQAQVDVGAFSGAVSAIARNGKVGYLRAVGFRDRTKTAPLQPDAIFWIASMTKPVVSVAAMMLVDEGKLDLDAPVHQYLPEFKDVLVGVETTDPAAAQTSLRLEPQKRPMTVEDLLRHTSGIVYGDHGDSAVYRLYRESGLYVRGLARDNTLTDFVSRLARLPLAHQPGEIWEYGHSADLLGRVVEVASGQPLDKFLDNRLFKPLGMVDTGFWVPPEKLARFVDSPADAAKDLLPDRDVTKPTTLFSGGGGLVSTAADFLRFCQMLLNHGELDGLRVLSPASVGRMTTNSLPAGTRSAGLPYGSAFGLGFAIRNDPIRSWVPGSIGSFSWSGVWGTYFWVDPAEKLIAIQLIHATRNFDRLFASFGYLTYGALLLPDQNEPGAASVPARIDQTVLAALEGTYRFTSPSSRDRQERLMREPGGLGIELVMQEGRLKVRSVIEGAPAAKAGVLAGDIITDLDGETLQGLTLSQAIEKMRGPVNTEVRLSVARKGREQPIELTIVRAQIRPTEVAADLQVAARNGKLLIEASGDLPILEFEKAAPVTAVPTSNDEFFVDGVDHTRLTFLRDGAARATGLVLDPGPWQITGRRID